MVPHAANTIITLSANPFHSKMYRHTYKGTRNIENYGKVLRFQSENGIEYTYYIVKLVLASALEFIFIFILMLDLKLCPPQHGGWWDILFWCGFHWR